MNAATLITLTFAFLIGGGLLAVLAGTSPRWSSRLGMTGVLLGSVVGVWAAANVLIHGTPVDLNFAWSMPGGSFHLRLDRLAAFFLIPTLLLSALAALYGSGYLAAHGHPRPLGVTWFSFNLLVASMTLVFLAQNAVLFLLAWEVMALSSFFLVMFDGDQGSVRRAGWLYLVATHLGTAFLLAFFALMARAAGSMEFDAFPAGAASAAIPAGLLFGLAIVGFGTKAGFMPLHVWLPEAHPAAPSHVSALMSGVMIKTGLYGLLRTLQWLPAAPPEWGWLLIAIGLASGIIGVLFAIAQRDFKRLLAYSSVENIGIITLGLGTGLLGAAYHRPAIAIPAFAGALLHIWNHAALKGLLFMGAGSVLHATGTRDLNVLGGLLKRMPWSGAATLVGAAGIAGLPPLGGFIGEFLILLAAFQGVGAAESGLAFPMIAALTGLALISGLALACFANTFGSVFLGEPRSPAASGAHEVAWSMRLPMLILAVLGLASGLFAPELFAIVRPVAAAFAGASAPLVAAPPVSLGNLSAACAILLALGLFLVILRRLALKRRAVRTALTWDCGYAEPTPRMQYTASSFAQPITDLFRPLLRTHRRIQEPTGYFPSRSALHTETGDVAREKFYRPLFIQLRDRLALLRHVQEGRVQRYVLYVGLTLLALLVLAL